MIRCIAVDDEPFALKVLEAHIGELSFLSLQRTFTRSVEAIAYLRNNPIDLVFLDVNMPGMDGFSLIKSISDAPKVVLTTAYEKYAVSGYEYGVSGYLVKPIKFESFVQTVLRVCRMIEEDNPEPGYTFVKVGGISYKIEFDKLIYIEKAGNNAKFIFTGKELTLRLTVGELLAFLPVKHFIQTHRSFVINLMFLDRLDGYSAMVGGHEVPIGEQFKNELIKIVRLTHG